LRQVSVVLVLTLVVLMHAAPFPNLATASSMDSDVRITPIFVRNKQLRPPYMVVSTDVRKMEPS